MIEDDKIKAAKEYDIISLAREIGLSPAERGGRTRRDTAENGLVYYPVTKSFYDYYSRIGGDTIKLVRTYRGCSFEEAVRYISQLAGYTRTEREAGGKQRTQYHGYDSTQEQHKELDIEKDRKETNNTDAKAGMTPAFLLPERNRDEKRLYAYLSKTRHISDEVIRRLLHEHLIYESADKHNVVFVCKDVDGQARHAMLRGTASDVTWRGDVSGGDKQHYGFSVSGTGNELLIFEAPIDLMSYMTLYPDSDAHLLALGNVAGTSIDRYLAEHSGVNSILLLLDNDRKGYEGMTRLMQTYKARGYECNIHGLYLYLAGSGRKDVNEYLCMKRENLPEPAKQEKEAVHGQRAHRRGR